MAMAFVQGVVKSSAGTPAAAPAFASSIAVGDLIVVYAATDTATTNRITSISDSLGNSYTRVPSFNVTGNTVSLDAFYSRVTASGSANVVTIVFNDTADNLNAVIQHFNGFTGIATLDVSAKGAIASATSWTSAATITTTAAAELIVGGAVHSSTVSAFSLGSGFTNLTQSSVANRQIAMESKLVAATGTQTATFSVAAARAGLAGVLTFKDVSTGTTYTQSLTASVSPTGSLSTAYIPVVLLDTLIDNFNDNSRDAVKWFSGINGTSTVIETNNRTEITMPSAATAADYASLNSQASYSLLNSAMYMQTITMPNSATAADATMTAIRDASNFVRTVYESGTLYFQYMKAGTRTTAATVGYSSSVAWWRIREGTYAGGTAGTVYWDTSPDGTTWTNQASFVHGMAASLVKVAVNIEGYTYQVETNPGQFIFDNFNTPGGIIYTQGLTASVSPAGAFAKFIKRTFTGGMTGTGSFIRRTARSMTASLSPAGSFASSLSKLMSFAASMTPTATLASQKIITRLFTASMAMTGTFTKRINKPFTAGMTSTGTFVKRITRSFIASVTPSGALTKLLPKVFTAALSPTGSFAKSIRKSFTAGMTSSGSISRAIRKNFVASVTPVGTFSRQLVKIMLLTADMTFVGSMGILRRMYFTAGLTFSTSFLPRWISGVASIFAPLTSILTSTIQTITDLASRNDTTMSGTAGNATVQDATSVATVDGAVTITNISANTNTDTLNNPTNKAEL